MPKKISNDELQVVEGVIRSRFDYLKSCLENLKQDKISTDDRTALVNVLSEEFARSGLGIDDEPNDFGKEIDEIIGKLDFEDE